MAHIHEKIDFTTSCFLVHDGRVLFVHHKKHGKWLQPGGHIELAEDPLEALSREIEEEVGLSGDQYELVANSDSPLSNKQGGDLTVPQWINRHRTSDTHEHVDLVYVAHARTDAVRSMPEENDGVMWCDKDTIAKLDTTDDVRAKALIALELVSRAPTLNDQL